MTSPELARKGEGCIRGYLDVREDGKKLMVQLLASGETGRGFYCSPALLPRRKSGVVVLPVAPVLEKKYRKIVRGAPWDGEVEEVDGRCWGNRGSPEFARDGGGLGGPRRGIGQPRGVNRSKKWRGMSAEGCRDLIEGSDGRFFVSSRTD